MGKGFELRVLLWEVHFIKCPFVSPLFLCFLSSCIFRNICFCLQHRQPTLMTRPSCLQKNTSLKAANQPMWYGPFLFPWKLTRCAQTHNSFSLSLLESNTLPSDQVWTWDIIFISNLQMCFFFCFVYLLHGHHELWLPSKLDRLMISANAVIFLWKMPNNDMFTFKVQSTGGNNVTPFFKSDALFQGIRSGNIHVCSGGHLQKQHVLLFNLENVF